MAALPTEIQARRDAEDRAAQLGQERAELAKKARKNTKGIKDLLPVALESGLTMEALAQLTKVSRQTLHQWRSEASDD